MINFIKKLIPVEIKIKSLYWKQKESEMESDLIKIYHPDNLNGDTGTIQEINREYQVLMQKLEVKYQ